MRPDERSLARRAAEKLRDWFLDLVVLKVTALIATVAGATAAAAAAWHGDLSPLARGMLWGVAAILACEAVAIFIAWLWLYLSRRAAATEVQELVDSVRSVIFIGALVYGPDKDPVLHPPGTFESVRRTLHAELVRSKRFKNREKLFDALRSLDQEADKTGGSTWTALKPHLDRLEAWADFVDRGFLLRYPPNDDPLEWPPLRQRLSPLEDPE